MTVYVGPTNWWWVASPSAPISCKVKAVVRTCPNSCLGVTLTDGSRIICVGDSSALIVAPCCTQVGSAWAGGQYNATVVGDKCCVSEWPGLQSQLTSCGFTPSDWCVPSQSDLFLSYNCRSYWDYTSWVYWSSTESSFNIACRANLSDGSQGGGSKSNVCCVRAFRRVTY
jgi:hypothetical protein